jgi:hypothetical protein
MTTATKQQAVSTAGKVIAHTARHYGYRGNEIAAYLEKTPVSITMYLRPDGEVNKAMGILLHHLDNATNTNNEV